MAARKPKLKHLTEAEMGKLDINSRDVLLRIKDVSLASMEIRVMEKNIEIIKRDIALARKDIAEKNTAIQSKKSKNGEYVTQLQDKYKVTKLSYDPLSGEINKDI